LRFKECLVSLSKGLNTKNTDRNILVPLTSSLYVPGKLADTDKVIVDVGTGFYVEKRKSDAKVFYEGKVTDLQANLEKLEAVVRQKTETLRAVEEGELIEKGEPR
jgi:prefoldin alpha subunit